MAVLRRYAVAAAFARLADEMTGTAVVLLVLTRTGSPALAGATVMAYTLPSVASGPLLGAWLDRTDRRRTALAGNGALLALVCVGLVLTAGRSPAVVLLGLTALAGVAVPMTSGGYSTLVPNLVPATELGRATRLDASVFNIAAIAGPALAGVVAASAGAAVAVLVIAAAALVGAGATAALPAIAGTGQSEASLMSIARGGLAHLGRTPPLRGATITTVLGYGSVGVLTIALPLYAERLGVAQASAGYLWAAIEVGALLTTLTFAGRLPRMRPELVVFGSTAGYGLVMLSWPLVPSFGLAVVVTFAAGLAEGLTLPAVISARQRYTPARLLGQVSVTGASMKIGAFALGAGAGGILVPAAGPLTAIVVVALAQFAATGIGWLAARPWA